MAINTCPGAVKPREAIRWVLVALSGGCGVYILATSIWGLAGDFSAFILVVAFCCSAVFMAPAYLLARRRYHQLVIFSASIGSIVVWGLLMWLPFRYGPEAWLDQWGHRPIWPLLLLAPVYVVVRFFFPIWVAIRFFCLALRMAGRWLYGYSPSPENV